MKEVRFKENVEDPVLAAVITAAALAASEDEERAKDDLIVRRIQRGSGQRSAWSFAGILDNMESRRF